MRWAKRPPGLWRRSLRDRLGGSNPQRGRLPEIVGAGWPHLLNHLKGGCPSLQLRSEQALSRFLRKGEETATVTITALLNISTTSISTTRIVSRSASLYDDVGWSQRVNW